MQDAPGYASRMFRALASEGINIEMVTTSEIRITCLVDETLIGEAARALHAAFELEKPVSETGRSQAIVPEDTLAPKKRRSSRK